jgi:hypothetical protein
MSLNIHFINLFPTQDSRQCALAVIDEADDGILLLHNITPDEIYKKQDELSCYILFW